MHLNIEGLQKAEYLKGYFHILKITFVANIEDTART